MRYHKEVEKYEAIPLRDAIAIIKNSLKETNDHQTIWKVVTNKAGNIFEIGGHICFDRPFLMLSVSIPHYKEDGMPAKYRHNDMVDSAYTMEVDAINSDVLGRVPFSKGLTNESLIDFLDDTDLFEWNFGHHIETKEVTYVKYETTINLNSLL